MRKKIRKLWIKALKGDAKAYRILGRFYGSRIGGSELELSRLCLEKAVELGDEEAFFILHQRYSKGKMVIDDSSYEKMWEMYQKGTDPEEKKKLKRYLHLGTAKQKGKMTEKR